MHHSTPKRVVHVHGETGGNRIMREITCSKCQRLLGEIEGNVLDTKYEVETTGRAVGRYSEAYIICECGNKEEFIY